MLPRKLSLRKTIKTLTVYPNRGLGSLLQIWQISLPKKLGLRDTDAEVKAAKTSNSS